jgi:hypothetical protein
MSTSNSTSFNQTASQIIADSLTLLGVYGQGDTVSSADIAFCMNILNKMVKNWEGQGIHLWTANEAAIFLTVGQQSYKTASTDTDIGGVDPIFNYLTVNASGNTLTVPSTAGVLIGDFIGIQLSTNVLQWTTVATIPDVNTITTAANLTAPALAGASVFSFTTRLDRPLQIINARFWAQGGGFERPVEMQGRTQYMYLPNKMQTGKCVAAFYAPKVSESYFYTWPTADSCGDCIRISYVRRIQDFAATSDNPDLPQEWLECITYNLAVRVASAYGIATAKLNPDISQIAAQSLAEMSMYDSEPGSLHIVPNYNFSDRDY